MTPSPAPVVLDACVLVDACLRDTLLRLAETPQQYSPRWSAVIMDEVGRTSINKLGRTQKQWAYLHGKLLETFPEAWVEDFEPLLPRLTNHEKDRHAVAAAVRTGARAIVTYNLKDFRPEDLKPWNVEARTPDQFRTDCLDLNSSAVIAKLDLQAAESGKHLTALLERLRCARVNQFANQVRAEINDMRGRTRGAAR